MNTLLQLYQENKFVKGISQRIYFANITLFTQELLEVVRCLKKDIYYLSTAKSTEDNAYKINNILYVIHFVQTMKGSLWGEKYVDKSDIDKFEKVIDRFAITKKFEAKIINKLQKCVALVKNTENKKILESFVLLKLNEINNPKSKKFKSYKSELETTCERYLKDIREYRQSKGFVVLGNREHDDWIPKYSSEIFESNAKILEQKGPTIMVDTGQFYANLVKMKYAKDRSEFFHKAMKAETIHTLWNRTVLKKVQLSQEAGFDNYVDFATQNNILNNKSKVKKFLNSQLKKYKDGYEQTLAQLKVLSLKDGNDELTVSDIRYYLDKIEDCDTKDYYFKMGDVLLKLKEFLKKHFNIALSYRSLPKVGVNYWITLKDLKTNQKNSLLLTSLQDENFTNRSHNYFNQFKRAESQSIINIESKDEFLTYQEVGIVFHEFGHMLQNFLSFNKYENLSKEIWEIVEVPSMLLETLSKSYDVLKDMIVYEDKKQPQKMTRDIFNLLQKLDTDSDFEKYLENKKHLIMVSMFSQNYTDIKLNKPSKKLNDALIKHKIPYLWTDSANNFMSDYSSDYGVMPYIYNFAQEIVNVIIEKINKKCIIEDREASIEHVFRNVLTSNDGNMIIDKLKKIYKERNYVTI